MWAVRELSILLCKHMQIAQVWTSLYPPNLQFNNLFSKRSLSYEYLKIFIYFARINSYRIYFNTSYVYIKWIKLLKINFHNFKSNFINIKFCSYMYSNYF